MIVQALNNLRPNAEWNLRGDKLEWNDTAQTAPTQAEIDAEILRLQKLHVATQYQRDRAVEYAKLNQDELRFDDMMNGTTTWKDAVLAIKAKIPKSVI